MKKTYLADPVKAGVAGLFSLFLLVLLPEFVRQQNIAGMIVFGALFLIFGGIAVYSARLVTVSKEGLCVSYFGLLKKQLSWDQIREVGVMGLKVFKSKKSKATGLLYIYFSEENLTDQERFNIALKWPVRHIPYMLYTIKRLENLQFLWKKPLTFYNADKVRFFFK